MELLFTKDDFIGRTNPAYHDDEGDSPYRLKIPTLPTYGKLFLQQSTVTAGQEIFINDIQYLKYVSSETQTDAHVDTFEYQIADTGSQTYSNIGTITINVSEVPAEPRVSDNQGYLNSSSFVFSESSFTKGYTDPKGDPTTYDRVFLKSVPSVTTLKLAGNPAINGDSFLASGSGTLLLELDPKYAIHNSVLYEFSKDIDLIIQDYNTLGLELIANVQGLLTFIDPNNLSDIRFVQGEGIPNTELEIGFTTRSSVSGLESSQKTFKLLPWENVNLKDNFILQSGSTGSNPVTGLAVTGDDTKTIKITFADASTITADFTDNNTQNTVTVTDTNGNATRHKVSEVEGTPLYETVTSLGTPTLEDNILTLKYNKEDGQEQVVQLNTGSAGDNRLITITIPLSETTLSESSTEEQVQDAVRDWLNTNGFTKTNIDTISWEIVDDTIVVVTTWDDSTTWDDNTTWTE